MTKVLMDTHKVDIVKKVVNKSKEFYTFNNYFYGIGKEKEVIEKFNDFRN